jgi:hypothetical protein
MRIHSVTQLTALALLSCAYCASALAQSASRSPQTHSAEATEATEPAASKNLISRESLLGVDTDGDGIRDDIEAIVARQHTAASTLHSKPAATEKERTLASMGEMQPVRKDPPRRTCLDYLMLDPKQRYKADLRLSSEANGVLGMHPCDPVMSPLLERPFEEDFLQLDLGPVFLRY